MYATKEAVLQAKVLDRVQRNTPSIEQIMQQIIQDGTLVADEVLPHAEMSFSSNGHVYADYLDNHEPFTKFSLNQMAEKSGVPARYVNSIKDSEWGRDLIAHIFQEHATEGQRENILIRSINGQVRGVLSDKYKIMDSMQIFKSFLSGALGAGAKLYDGLHTQSKNFLEVVHPDLIPFETPNNGVVNLVMGARIRNSDFGDGALSVRVFSMNAICLNGMVGEQLLREVHLGSRIDNIRQYLTSETMAKETAAQAAIVGDTMEGIFHADAREKEIDRIMVASDRTVDMQAEIKALPALGVRKEEAKAVEGKLMENNPEDGVQGANTVWKLVQSLTSVANEVDSPARGRELQEIASKMF